MVKPFKLSWSVGHSDSMNKEDIENTKQALDALGLYEPPQLFTERFSTKPMIQGLKKFQRREGLQPDGVMNPEGPTHRRMNAVLERNSGSGTPELNDTPNLTSNKSLQSSIVHDKPETEEFGDQSFKKDREAVFTDATKTLEKTAKEIKSKDIQTAAVPVAAPFAVWLVEYVGAASIVAAMAIYNSWNKKQRTAVRMSRRSGVIETRKSPGPRVQSRGNGLPDSSDAKLRIAEYKENTLFPMVRDGRYAELCDVIKERLGNERNSEFRNELMRELVRLLDMAGNFEESYEWAEKLCEEFGDSPYSWSVFT